MVHFWIIAETARDDANESSHKWISLQKSLLKELSCASSDCRWHIIPRLPWSWLDAHEHMAAVRDAYHVVAERLGSAICNAPPSDRFVAILDARGWNNLQEMSSLQSVQGLLILAFPDVLWVPIFNVQDEQAKMTVKKAVDLAIGGFNPMFDGTGVRGALIRTHKPNSTYPYNRDDVAISIDEELHFAELTAYTAFRFGYRVYPVSTERLARQTLLVDSKEDLPSLAGAKVSPDAALIAFEDGCVEFPDLTQDGNEQHHLGTERDSSWPLLSKANLRVLATAAGEEDAIAQETVTEGDTTDSFGDPQSLKETTQKLTAAAWFRKKNVEDVGDRKNGMPHAVVEKACRRMFNLFAGGAGFVWLWNLIRGSLIAIVLLWILLRCPVFLVPALFFVFAIFGLFRKVIVKGAMFLWGRRPRFSTCLKIRSQWRFYPKMYVKHVPQRQIQQDGARFWCLVRKPLGGIFELRNQCGLPNGRHFSGQLDALAVREIYKNAVKGHAPTVSGANVEDSSHAAYGMTLDLATDLIGRARVIKGKIDAGGVEEAIHAAVLATCAYELLGHKTPALSIEALTLRHYFEVLAECEFSGVRARLDMEDRLVDIHNSLSQICRASNGAVREEMFESGMAAICDNLSELLRSRGRYEEAAFLSRQSRYMHRLLLPPFLRNLLAFPEWAVRSKINFFTSLTIFLGVFAIYYKIRIDTAADFSDVLSKMYELLFSTQPNMDLTEIMATAKPRDVKTVVEVSESLQLAVFNVDPELKERISSATTVVQAMRQLALIHIGFLAALFYDFMHRK